VLANLVKQTPTEILAALKAGNVSLDGDSQQKTESIIRCIDYSHSNLSPAAQNLLICFAPFTSVFDTRVLKVYTDLLKQQPNLATLPFEHWSEILHEAENWGLLTPDPDNPSYLHLQPVLPYFLQTRLALSGQEIRTSIELAFRQLYEQYAEYRLEDMLTAKEAQERQIGQYIVSLEYENLLTALQLALNAHIKMVTLHLVLREYLTAAQDKERMLELNRIVLDGLEKYPASMWSGNDAFNLFSVMGNIANSQLDLKQYKAAEESYKKLLVFAKQATGIDEKVLGMFKATVYHNLGIVAQEQRQWQQAEQYYQQALQIYEEYHERYEQASTYHNLGIVAQEQRQWEQAEQYYQQALQIKQEHHARYEQASTYHQLGRVAQEQRQWERACEYFLKSLEICIAYNEQYYIGLPLYQLAKLWQERGDTEILTKVAAIMKISQDEVEAMFRERLEGESGEAEK
jgi:tetratricopeptide (TPR) repeat protein